MNRDLEAYWRGLVDGRAQEAADRYIEAKRRARVLGFDYVELPELANRSTIELLERLEKLGSDFAFPSKTTRPASLTTHTEVSFCETSSPTYCFMIAIRFVCCARA